MRRGREAWILGALVLVFVAAATYYGRLGFEEQRTQQPTTYSIDPDGLKVYYQLLERQGIQVRRFERPLNRLPDDAGVLVMAEPQQRKVAPDEDAALWSWVKKGGTLLLIVSGGVRNEEGRPLDLQGLTVQTKKALPADLPPNPEADYPLSRDVHRVHVEGAARLTDPNEEGTPLVQDSEGIYVATWSYDKGGTVVVATDGVMPSNRQIATADNAVLFVNIAQQRAKNRPVVLFDEYHQGFVAEEGGGRSLWAAVGAPARAALWYLLVVFLLVIYNANRRFGSPIALHPPEARPSTEYIEGMAGLFRRARAPELALEMIYHAFRHDLAARIDSAPDAPPETVAEAGARRFGWPADSVRTLLARCDEIAEGAKASEAEVLRLATEIQDYRRKAALVRI